MEIVLHSRRGIDRVTEIDDNHHAWLSHYKWHYVSGRRTGYAATESMPGSLKGVRVWMHQFILSIEGHPLLIPIGLDRAVISMLEANGEINRIDHVDGNGLNNRLANLRIATTAQNNYNRPKPRVSNRLAFDQSLYKGVSFNTKRRQWQAQIQHEGRNYHLGWFREEIEAAHAYDVAATERFGIFARLNFPPETH